MQKPYVIHPFLFCLYPVFALYIHNIDQVPIRVIIFPCLLVVVFTVLLWFSVQVILKNKLKAGIVVSLSLFSFFSFGHLGDFLTNLDMPMNLARHRYTLSFYSLLFIMGTYFTLRTKKDIRGLNNVLNIITISLMGISLLHITFYHLENSSLLNKDTNLVKVLEKIKIDNSGYLPDIYYIIPDGYAGINTLKTIYRYDNSEFLDFLADSGFYVATESHSNYPTTIQSLASSLNMDYLHNIINVTSFKGNNVTPLRNAILNNATIQLLRSKGYKLINYSSGLGSTDYMSSFDLNINPLGNVNEFTTILALSTMLKIFDDYGSYFIRKKQSRVLNTFTLLKEYYKEKGPKFILAHIISPHPPCVFGPNGELIPTAKVDLQSWEDNAGYTDEINFLNRKIKNFVEFLLNNSSSPPVIVIQADHGSLSTIPSLTKGTKGWDNPSNETLKERTEILNAIYLKNECKSLLYDNMTPVNTFRSIFNCYFATEFDRLDDNIYWSKHNEYYKYTEITDIVRSP